MEAKIVIKKGKMHYESVSKTVKAPTRPRLRDKGVRGSGGKNISIKTLKCIEVSKLSVLGGEQFQDG